VSLTTPEVLGVLLVAGCWVLFMVTIGWAMLQDSLEDGATVSETPETDPRRQR